MTKEEASFILANIDRRVCDDELNEALDMAIKALEQEPSVDAISRQAVLNTLDRMDKALDTDRTVESYKELLTECYKALPPVNPQEKTGHWIYTGDYLTEGMLKCSECGEEIDVSESYYNFCPICGAKMVETQEESEMN